MIDLSKVKPMYPPQITPWLEVKLTDDIMKYLWKTVKEGEERAEDVKHTLAGNISTSFALNDKDNYFSHEVLLPLARHYERIVPGSTKEALQATKGMDQDGRPIHAVGASIFLESFWANYQYKHEFNPLHNHGGAFSFVIWMKIPYNWEDQNKAKFLKGTDDGQKVPGTFYFEFLNMFGDITQSVFPMSPDMEGSMLFFPSELRHAVNPFYECDEKRISISGNLGFIFNYAPVIEA